MNNEILIKIYLILGIIIIFDIIIYLVCKFKLKDILGWAGEYHTKRALSKLPSEEYLILNNILLRQDDRMCQIDHIVFSKYGIFVIETKKYNGNIFGDRYDKYWVSKNGKYYINPINQNYGHVKCVQKILDLDDSQIFNIICMTGYIKVKAKYEELADTYDIVDKIISYRNEIIPNFKELYNIINEMNITDKKIRRRHNNEVKGYKKGNINKCPKCGGDLIDRNGKNGKFIGCNNYPKCKYSKNIKE